MTNFIQYNGRMMPVKEVIKLRTEEKANTEIKNKVTAKEVKENPSEK